MAVEYKAHLTVFSGVTPEYTLIKSTLYLKLVFGMRKIMDYFNEFSGDYKVSLFFC